MKFLLPGASHFYCFSRGSTHKYTHAVSKRRCSPAAATQGVPSTSAKLMLLPHPPPTQQTKRAACTPAAFSLTGCRDTGSSSTSAKLMFASSSKCFSTKMPFFSILRGKGPWIAIWGGVAVVSPSDATRETLKLQGLFASIFIKQGERQWFSRSTLTPSADASNFNPP